MKCPVDNETLTISERSGIEIDYCPQCRGVWLDRGELDKILERSGQHSSPISGRPQPSPEWQQTGYSHDYHHKKKKESFLGDLFDF